MSQGRGDFNAVCLNILKKVEDQLGQSLSIFNAPVDAKIYPEYSKYVDKPMDLGTIRGRLEKRIYRDAQEFCNVSALTGAQLSCTGTRQATSGASWQATLLQTIGYEGLLAPQDQRSALLLRNAGHKAGLG